MLPPLLTSTIEKCAADISSVKLSKAVVMFEWVYKSIHLVMFSSSGTCLITNSCLKSSWYTTKAVSQITCLTYTEETQSVESQLFSN